MYYTVYFYDIEIYYLNSFLLHGGTCDVENILYKSVPAAYLWCRYNLLCKTPGRCGRM